jgi:micrococcal nuclease
MKKTFLVSLALLFSLCGPNFAADTYYLVQRVVDGDTLKLANKERVRLIGVDTPESQENLKLYKDVERTGRDKKTLLDLGRKSKEYTKGLVQGKKIRLEYDVQKKDRYGRTLAYVYLEDGTFLNAHLVKQGYAQTMSIPPNVKHNDLFLKLQKEARDNRRGLWK